MDTDRPDGRRRAISRRVALGAAVGLVAALAGCSDDRDDDGQGGPY